MKNEFTPLMKGFLIFVFLLVLQSCASRPMTPLEYEYQFQQDSKKYYIKMCRDGMRRKKVNGKFAKAYCECLVSNAIQNKTPEEIVNITEKELMKTRDDCLRWLGTKPRDTWKM